uniref:Uncharacterized protein n=1 Tax=Rhizophora mucronata TaxID=61149 RepID=A0A2P2QR84_RHIMU
MGCQRVMLRIELRLLLVFSVLCFQRVSGKEFSVHHFWATVSTPKEFKACVSCLVLYVSGITGLLLHLLPSEIVGDTRVPKVIFIGLPSLFHAFVICICFAFIGAFSSLLTQDRPKYAKYEKFARLSAVAFLLLALSAVVCAIFFRSLHLILRQNDAALSTSG